MVDGKYVRMPIDSELFREFGGFLLKLSDVTDGVKVPEKEVDLEEIKAKIARLKGAA